MPPSGTKKHKPNPSSDLDEWTIKAQQQLLQKESKEASSHEEMNEQNSQETDIAGEILKEDEEEETSYVNIKETDKKKRRLNSLTRLLEGKNVCVAACFKNQTIYLTTNAIHRGVTLNNQSVQWVSNHLNHFIKAETSDPVKREAILKSLFEQKIAELDKGTNSLSLPQANLDRIVGYCSNELGKTGSDHIFHGNVFKKALLASSFFEQFLTEEQQSIKRNPTNYSSRDIQALSATLGKIQFLFSDHLWRLARDYLKTREFFQQYNPQDWQLLMVGEKGEHAEARLLGYLLETEEVVKETNENQLSLNIGDEELYIATSKKCCADCKLLLDAFQIALEKNITTTNFSYNDAHNRLFKLTAPAYIKNQTYLCAKDHYLSCQSNNKKAIAKIKLESACYKNFYSHLKNYFGQYINYYAKNPPGKDEIMVNELSSSPGSDNHSEDEKDNSQNLNMPSPNL